MLLCGFKTFKVIVHSFLCLERIDPESAARDRIHCLTLDLFSIHRIGIFFETFKKKFSKIELDVLIFNNAEEPSMWSFREKTDTGHDLTMMVYFGPWYLAHLLIDALKKEEGKDEARIIVVSSSKCHHANLNVNDLSAGYWDNIKLASFNYKKSQRARIYWVRELARRLTIQGINVNAVVLDTSKSHPSSKHGNSGQKTHPSSTPIICLASARSYKKTTGQYFDVCQEEDFDSNKLLRKQYTLKKAQQLWKATEEQIPLEDKEKQSTPDSDQSNSLPLQRIVEEDESVES